MTFRCPPDLGVAIEEWRNHQPDKPPRSEAIRQLIEAGLGAKRWAKPPK
jgi:hypothetical protein